MPVGSFGTAINCIDGRVQLPVINWMKATHHVDWVDVITEPGADEALASCHPGSPISNGCRSFMGCIAADLQSMLAVGIPSTFPSGWEALPKPLLLVLVVLSRAQSSLRRRQQA